MRVDVVIPALDEEHAIAHVIRALPRDKTRRIFVVDNGSTDRTAQVAREAGAEVLFERERGYGAACLRALEELAANPPDVVAFVDGDLSDYPEDLPALLAPIESGEADLVIASRAAGSAERGSLTLQQRLGNALACALLNRLYGTSYTDLGPFRAIRWVALQRLGMRDRNYGWTVEMQIRAARAGLAAAEVPARYRVRVGKSKVSGTVRGTIGASYKILSTIARYSLLATFCLLVACSERQAPPPCEVACPKAKAACPEIEEVESIQGGADFCSASCSGSSPEYRRCLVEAQSCQQVRSCSELSSKFLGWH